MPLMIDQLHTGFSCSENPNDHDGDVTGKIQILVLTILSGFLSALAQSPTLERAIPSAAAPGKTVVVTFYGANLAGAMELWTSFPAQTALVSDKSDAGKATWRI